MSQEKLIDLDQLFRSKNPGLYRWIPGFLLSYLKRVIHQDETNAFLEAHSKDTSFEFCEAVVNYVGVSYQMINLNNIPKSGACIVACNHPLGALEAMCLVTEIQKIRKDIKFIVNDLLLNLHSLRGVMVGVNKHGKTPSESLKQVNELFSSDQLIMLFPAGLVSRKRNGIIEDLEWKKTFITRSKKFNIPVIPVYIEAKNSNFFYNLSNLRTKLGLKMNIEMLYLVDEMYKQKGKHISFVFGNPVEPITFTTDKSDQQWADEMKSKVYQLKDQIK